MAKKILFSALGVIVLVGGFFLVAALTKRSNLSPALTQNVLPFSSPTPKPKLIGSGQVLGANKTSNSLTVEFDFPPMLRGKTQNVEIDCPTGESFVETATYNIRDKKPMVVTVPQPTNQLLFQIAAKKDKITGTCASESCTVFNKSCVLTRTVYIL